MDDPEPSAFFAERGFTLSFSPTGEGTVVQADLHAATRLVAPAYGVGTTRAQAAARAVERWRQEQGD